MVKPSSKVEFNTFVKGLITEASPLNFPKDASVDEENFELNRDGSRSRRRGMSFELEHVLIPTDLTEAQLNIANPVSYKWTEVAGDTEKNFLVVQASKKLYFFDMSKTSLTSEGYLGSLELTDFPLNTRYSLTSIDGYLLVAAGVETIGIVEYTGSTFTVEYVRLSVRDVWGISL